MKRTMVFLIAIIILGFSAADVQAQNLTGRWTCDDGGTYYLHQRGNELWWLGESKDNGATWTNVFQGQIAGNQIDGKWADVPQGRVMSGGIMKLQIINANNLRAINKTGGFGGSNWTRQGSTVPVAFNLNGLWKCNDGGKYYVRQIGNDVWWLGKSGDSGASWTNVFHGQVSGAQVNGSWSDVPHGRVMSGGVMVIQVVNANNFKAINRTGGFGGSNWTR
ncbi:MAG TPA: hypothetical protein DDY17_02065 [Syntrophaceae bacterium]|jgi:hypothetical protein|nr:hypothetical protein [Syntrophaceae bacterium]